MTVIYQKNKTTRFFNLVVNFNLKFSWLKSGVAVGTYSICEDGKHIIYLDYDNFRYEWLKDELKHLKEKYKLSNFYILRSSKSETGHFKHHAVCFDKVTAREYNEIVMESNADMLFKKNNFFDLENSRVLRFSAKSKSQIQMPYYHSRIRSKHCKRKKSLAHIGFYNRMFGIKNINRKNHDGKTGIGIIQYTTQNL